MYFEQEVLLRRQGSQSPTEQTYFTLRKNRIDKPFSEVNAV